MFLEKPRLDFNNLFIFDMANNHQGRLEHGLAIIHAVAEVVKKTGVKAAVKFQFRELDTLIHPDYKDGRGNKHIPRFFSTRLSEKDFVVMTSEVRKCGLITMSTPFDEASVAMIERLGIEVIKVASSSAHDWPLLERIAETGKPVICSTGGLSVRDIDRVVSFFQHRGTRFALMHCIAAYPVPNDQLQLNYIGVMRDRYPGVTIGFSTHEDPNNLNAVRLAYAKGARIFEKHVGLPTETIKLNAYSANPEQLEAWIGVYQEAVSAYGKGGEREIIEKERNDLRSLMRGVYAKKAIRAGAPLRHSDVFFAMPLLENQLAVSQWRGDLIADCDYVVNAPLNQTLYPEAQTKREIIYSAIHAAKGMLNNARISLGHDFLVELSHQYGLERFYEIGCVIVECFNRKYAKKLIIQTVGQWNPIHYHKAKDETFHVLHGIVDIEIEGKKKTLEPGDTLWVPQGVWHGFGTKTGAIIEGISTTSAGNDSVYVDRAIAAMPREERKTQLLNWGRHQFDDFGEKKSGKETTPHNTV